MAKKNGKRFPINRLEPFEDNRLNTIIEVPKNAHYKSKYDPELGLFKLDRVLPAGAIFPFDFGFIPGTLGEDGDPLDILVLMDEPTFVGCLVPARLVGVIQANQTEKGMTTRNDRLIAVAVHSNIHRDIISIDQLSQALLSEIEHFFVSYNEMSDKHFQPIRRSGVPVASQTVQIGVERYRKEDQG